MSRQERVHTMLSMSYRQSINSKHFIWLTFALTLLCSAFLVFALQPLVAKMLLPKLGGSPAVWNTCMLFFQILLLLGYCYAHLLSEYCPFKLQAPFHLCCLILSLHWMSIDVTNIPAPPIDSNLVLWILQILTQTVGLPFLLLSASAPLLQKWISNAQEHVQNPYALYSISNIGSILALAAYPFIIEPFIGLHAQTNYWTYLYLMTIGLMLMITAVKQALFQTPAATETVIPVHDPAPSWQTRGSWILLSFVPSCLLLATTAHITTDVAAIPLLWNIPLAIYLLSFIICFSNKPIIKLTRAKFEFPFALSLVTVFIATEDVTTPIQMQLVIYLYSLFVFCMYCHGTLIARKPSTKYLTQFYCCLSLGGMLGGVFCALLAPILFNRTLEFPIALILLAAVYAKTEKGWTFSKWDLVIPFCIVMLFTLIMPFHLYIHRVVLILVLCLSIIACVWHYDRIVTVVLGLIIILVARPYFFAMDSRSVLVRHRSFMGISRLVDFNHMNVYALINGTTLHGAQFKSQKGVHIAHTYYLPASHVISWLRESKPKLSIGVAGLGVGTLSCYTDPHDNLDFYEINPWIVRLAQSSQYFTYLRACAPNHHIRLGDARLQLAKAPDHTYDLIVLDTFSSDAIPVHILTKQALALYLQKLSADGVLLFNITNRHLDLIPVLSRLAQEFNLRALSIYDNKNQGVNFRLISQWVVLLPRHRHSQALQRIGFKPLPVSSRYPLWTDDYSNIVSILKFYSLMGK